MLSLNLPPGKRSNISLLATILLILVVIYFLPIHTFSPLTTTLQNHEFFSGSSTTKIKQTSQNVAAIIEDRPLSNLIPLILHFSSVLGPNWPIHLFTSSFPSPSNQLNQQLNASLPLQRAIAEGRISIRSLPSDTSFENHAAVSDLLTRPWFWEQLAPASHVLLFQADSILCSNSEISIDSFLDYDFVGAPISTSSPGNGGHGEGYNGGLSLRNRNLILDIIRRFDWREEKKLGIVSEEGCVTKKPCLKFEDQWFYSKMKGLLAEGVKVRLPTMEVAAGFAVETVWGDRPLGYHQVGRWWRGEKLESVERWCPEYRLATGDLLVNHGKAGS